MVMCSSNTNQELGRRKSFKMTPRPHSINANKTTMILPSTASSTHSSIKGFRLQDANDDTGSVYSLYKQKIDSMFSDTITTERAVQKYQEKLNNCVQARIERMFSDITKDVDQRLNEITSHSFTVDYLGSVQLDQKVTSLSGLQQPLKQLYFAYRKNLKLKPDNALTGRLEISAGGLKVRYEGEKGDLEQLNTFPTIAVWSAVKFVLHRGDTVEYAFLPLITDPDNINKNSLFRTLDSAEQKYITNDAHSPLFAVVMRKIGVAKQLECHGFVCQTSEDAIVIAATLYKSLMAFMTQKGKGEKKPKNRNGISCMSVASTNNNNSVIAETKSNSLMSVPIRPPRKKRSTTSSTHSSDSQRLRNVVIPKPKRTAPKMPSPKTNRQLPPPPPPPPPPPQRNPKSQDLDAIISYPENSNKTTNNANLIKDFNDAQNRKLINDEIKQVFATDRRQYVHNQSIRKNNKSGDEAKNDHETNLGGGGILSTNPDNSGDILTKVAIPRSGSFLNAKGLTRYKSTISRSNGQASGGSPLGFNELFNEFRLQEGLNSLDEILGAIIDSEGMSFNDLKPIYKEFLLKLALTLTKDELYARSKSIMRRQKKKLLRRNSSNQNRRKKMIIGAKGLRKVFRRSFKVRFTSKFKTPSPKKDSLRRTSFDFVSKKNLVNSTSSVSTSSYDTRQFNPREITMMMNSSPQPLNRKQSYRKRSENRILSRASTSEDSDFFTLQRQRQKCRNQGCSNHNNNNSNTQNRNSSSGYVSCSECSYDSDSCTCVSADKCYCSLGQRECVTEVNEKRNSLTASCRSEDKCFCSLKSGKVCDTNHAVKYEKVQSVGNEYYRPINAVQSKLGKARGSFGEKPETSLSWCGCDTDSCTDSNKCYCQTEVTYQEKKNGTIFEQLKERGFIPSAEALMTTPPRERKPSKKYHNKSTKSSKSLEYLKNPEENAMYYEQIKPKKSVFDSKRSYSSDNLALDYELFTVTGNDGVKGPNFGRTASEGGFRSVFRATDSMRSFNRGTINSNRNNQSGGIGGNHEALSVKKSAEIAALFADVKLSQTTDITHLMASDEDSGNPFASKLNSRINSHLEQQRKALLEQQQENYRQIFATGLYAQPVGSVASRNSRGSFARVSSVPGSRGSVASRNSAGSRKNKSLYSARNGLYTIQSQSDDSRRSSSSEKQTGSLKGYYGDVRHHHHTPNPDYIPLKTSLSCNLENSLGYLP